MENFPTPRLENWGETLWISFWLPQRTWQRDFPKGMSENVYFQFLWFANAFPSNLNTMNLKIFSSHGEIYMFNRKFNNSSGGSGKLQVKSVSLIVVVVFFFGHKKRIDFKRSLELHFFASIIGFFYLPSFNSELRKRLYVFLHIKAIRILFSIILHHIRCFLNTFTLF